MPPPSGRVQRITTDLTSITTSTTASSPLPIPPTVLCVACLAMRCRAFPSLSAPRLPCPLAPAWRKGEPVFASSLFSQPSLNSFLYSCRSSQTTKQSPRNKSFTPAEPAGLPPCPCGHHVPLIYLCIHTSPCLHFPPFPAPYPRRTPPLPSKEAICPDELMEGNLVPPLPLLLGVRTGTRWRAETGQTSSRSIFYWRRFDPVARAEGGACRNHRQCL